MQRHIQIFLRSSSQISRQIRLIHQSTPCLAQPVAKKKQTGPAVKGGFIRKGQEVAVNSVLRTVQANLDPSLRRPPVAPQELAVEWTPEMASTANVNSMMRISSLILEKLASSNKFEWPKSLVKDWALTGEARALVFRKNTLELIQEIKNQSDGNSSNIVLQGPAGIGKSALMVQAVTYFAETGWLVLYIPRAGEATTGFYPYYYNQTTKKYDQPELVAQLLSQFKALNQRQLSNVMMSGSHEAIATIIPSQRNKGQKVVPKLSGISLDALCDIGIKNEEYAVAVWTALLKELTSDAISRPPFLLAIDQLAALFMEKTEYWTTESIPIPSHDFAFAHSLLTILSSKPPVKNGSVLTALDETESNVRSPFLSDSCLGTREKPNWLKNVQGDVIVSKEIAPGAQSTLSQDEFMKQFENVNWKLWSIPRWTLDETMTFTRFLKKAKVSIYTPSTSILDDKENQEKLFAERVKILGGGIAKRIFIASTQYRSPGTSPKIVSIKKLKKEVKSL